MTETRRKFDQDFKEGAVRLVRVPGKPIAQIGKDLGINEGILGDWGAKDRGPAPHAGCGRPTASGWGAAGSARLG